MYCLVCGARLPAPPPSECNTCGTQAWADAKPCACAVISNKEGEILLIKRAAQPWKGHWDIPGGFCNPGEHPIVTAEREAFEETGLRVRVTRFIGIWLTPYNDPKIDQQSKETMNIFYEAHLVDSEVTNRDPDEVEELRWFSAKDVPADIAFPEAQRPALDVWIQSRSRSAPASLPDRPH
jgi:ADP-ribose pyrophosphatase YjhB (NUDIX family)